MGKEIRDTIVADARRAFGDDLVSVVLFGSAVAGGFSARYSDYNVLLVCRRIEAAHLSALSRVMPRWGRKRVAPPVFFTREELERSADVFPMEFLDLGDRRDVLYGEDVIAKLKVGNANLRLQCESQLKGKLQTLRQGMALAGNSRRALRLLLLSLSSSLVTVFRGLLRLKGQAVPASRREVIDALEKVYGISTDVFEKVNDLRESGGGDVRPLVSSFLSGVESLVRTVDRMGA
jgi:predicted nucleotidyltransferase